MEKRLNLSAVMKGYISSYVFFLDSIIDYNELGLSFVQLVGLQRK